jgi:hypothetical protein
MRLFFGLLFISFQLNAASWSELEVSKTYKLSQYFQLPQKERSGAFLDFMKGESFTLKEIVPMALPGANLLLYLFNYENCPGLQMKTELEIVPVQGSSPVVEAGVSLEEGCELNVYIESRDYFSKSLF